MVDLDPRLHPFRDNLAAAYLKGRVEAAGFVEGERRQVIKGLADLRREPRDDAPLDSQLLYGEQVNLYDEADGWAWVQNVGDSYVGYVRSEALGKTVTEPSHSVSALRSYLLPEPDVKAPPLDLLSMASPVTVVEENNGYSRLANGGWLYSRHLAPLDALAEDFVATALDFLGTPYYWGGRSSIGIDCSAFVQIVLARAGVFSLRDTYMQAETLGELLPAHETPQRGDLVFFPGHVVIALDAETTIHANALHMAVAIEPLEELERRIRQSEGEGITGIRRLRRSG